MAYNFQGKVALVTGGALGVGAEVVRLLLERGAKVASMDVVEHQRPGDGDFLPITASVTSQQECTQVLQRITERWGKLDVLVNNAGVMDSMEGVTDTTDKVWSHVLDVNLNGPMYLMRAGIPLMLKNDGTDKGAIVNVSSVSSLRGAVSGAAYGVAKSALNALSKNTAWTYRKEGIRCNAILPGGVMSNIIRNSRSSFDPNADYTQKLMHACMPGMVSTTDCAEAIIYLISAQSVNGEELVIDRGWMMA